MKLKSERIELIAFKEAKRHYATFKTKELELLKAAYEANEEDNKQIAILLSLITIILTLFNLALNSLLQNMTPVRAVQVFILVPFVVFGVVAFGYRTSVRNVNTTRTRKIIDIVLAERAAAKVKQNPPTPTS